MCVKIGHVLASSVMFWIRIFWYLVNQIQVCQIQKVRCHFIWFIYKNFNCQISEYIRNKLSYSFDGVTRRILFSIIFSLISSHWDISFIIKIVKYMPWARWRWGGEGEGVGIKNLACFGLYMDFSPFYPMCQIWVLTE